MGLMLEIIALVFFAGVLTRIADMVADDNLRIGHFSYLAGAAYGFMAALAMFFEGALSELVIAVMLAVVISREIDHPVHYTALATFIITMLFFGIPSVNMILVAVFIFTGIADEMLNNLADRGKIKGVVGRFFGYRLTMEIVTFAISAYTGVWILFFAMLAYDAGFTYVFPEPVRRKLLRLGKQ
jgi:hypothetical protein